MPDTTPTTELRAAASLLRDKATAAIHEGRTTWSTGNTLGSRSPVVLDDQEQPSVLIETYAARLERVNSYLALLGPATGLAVADWLDDTARFAVVYADMTVASTGAAPVEEDHDSLTRHALMVARQVLGATDQQPETAPAADLREQLRREFGKVLHRWGLLDEVNDPAAAEEFAVTDLLSVLPAPADRAAVLREAASSVESSDVAYNTEAATAALTNGGPFALIAFVQLAIGAHLRRMADEAQQPETEAATYPPAFPWAALMDAEDLAEFLAEVEHAVVTPGATPAEALAAAEKACSTWRVIAEVQHGHNTAPGPHS